MQLRSLLMSTLAGAAAFMALPAAAQQGISYERLLNADAESQNWLMIHGNYSNWRSSRLSQINRSNVGQLVPKFTVAVGGWGTVKAGFVGNARGTGSDRGKEETIPLAADGFIYTEDSLSKVSKVDVRSGKRGQIVWRFDPDVSIYRNRKGVALMDDKVHVSTGDMRQIALNANTGAVIWETNTWADPQKGSAATKHERQYSTAAPRVVRSKAGKNIVTMSETGSLGWGNHWIAGLDADTGKLMWRWWSIPAPGEPGHETWKNDAWMTGGGGFWSYPAWDPTTNVIVGGTGDCYPTYDPEFRPGDNLYCASSYALDIDTGELKWYFSATPNERWDLDNSNIHMLWTHADGSRIMSTFERQGFWYNHDLDLSAGDWKPGAPAKARFRRATQYVDQITWTKGIDPKTGMPLEYDPRQNVQVYGNIPGGKTPRQNLGAANAVMHCPTWNNQNLSMEPGTLDINKRMVYATVNDGCIMTAMTAFPQHDAQGNVAAARIGKGAGSTTPNTDVDRGFSIIGIKLDTGERTKLAKFPWNSNETGLLGTDGGLLFVGWHNGDIQAVDKDTGVVLWTYSTGIKLSGAIMTYAVDGKQYIAVQAGSDHGQVSNAPAADEALGGFALLYVFGLPG
jgi:alcohol dehydrogenase (cytochrome c)